MERWLNGTARELAQRLPHHHRKLRELESRAVPAAPVISGGAPPADRLSFADSETQFQYDILSKLVAGLERFVDPDPHVGAIAAVRERLSFARRVQHESIEAHAAEWDAAIASIANPAECPAYAGLRISPQLGLIPVGRDPDSGLWEFAHLRTGEVPVRRPDGRFSLDERNGLVMVLIPGGCFWMGAGRTRTGAEGQVVCSSARDDESPVHRVCLDPFFLSKYEMTQAQWLRIAGENPSRWPAAAGAGRLRPVENVNWTDADYMARAVGLALPTEAQWEYAARAGVTAPWPSGPDRKELATSANLVDLSARTDGAPIGWPFERWHDGHADTAPTGTYRPNGFGLHDVIGNVWEWCRDGYGPYTDQARPGDGLRLTPSASERVMRGGDFTSNGEGARVTRRVNLPPIHLQRIGLRPSRPVEHLTSAQRRVDG
jgi:formylglycine-generating enzyme required for sulfatase activity